MQAGKDCWLNSGLDAMETVHQITTGDLYDLSRQQLIDHFSKKILKKGQSVARVFKYARKTPILERDEYGRNWGQKTKGVTIKGYKHVPYDDELSYIQALSRGPVCVGIPAAGDDFQIYRAVRLILNYID